MITTLTLPAEVKLSKPASSDALARMQRALDQGAALLEILPGPRTRPRVKLPLSLLSRIEALRARYPGETVTGIASRLVWTDWRGQRKAAPAAPADREAQWFANRPEQARLHAGIVGALERNAVVLAEGATGLGKSKVIAALAMRYARGGVIAAAPTLQVLGQLIEEYRTLAVGARAPAVRFILGRDQFVSETRLWEWIDDSEEGPAQAQAQARTWVARGAGAASPASAPFHAISPTLAWLAEDLAHLAPEAPLGTLRLTASDDPQADAAAAVYARLRERALADKAVTFCTQAALIWDTRLKERALDGLLPQAQTLIIDEAHQFAGQAESAFSRSVASRSLLSALRDEALWKPGRCVGAAREARRGVEEAMRALMDDAELAAIAEGQALDSLTLDRLRPVLAGLKAALGRLDGAGESRVSDASAALAEALSGNARVSLDFSPVLRFPSLTTGPRGLRFFFDAFWPRFQRAALLSATLYLPRRGAEPSHGLVTTSLHIPRERLRTMPPEAPAWVRRAQLHLAAPEETELIPPQENAFEDAEAYHGAQALWWDAVSRRIEQIAQTAAGGVLVLVPGYETIQAVGDRLRLLLAQRLVIQARGGFRRALAQFHDGYSRGVRMVWLATGPARTGLNLSSGPEPKDDWLLTDVVIPRIPYGTERSAIHRARMAWMNSAERDRAAFQLRQGIGRLIRREGVKNRRLWMLDGRLHRKEAAWLMAPVKAVLDAYRIDSTGQCTATVVRALD